MKTSKNINREELIKKASWIGIIGNAFLSTIKVVTGLLTGSLAVLSDGLDSMSDVLTSFITLIAAKIMSRPPDVRFPYGYGKAESIAAKIISFIIFYAGTQLAVTAISRLIKGNYPEFPSTIALIVTAISIAGKLILAFQQIRAGKKTNSEMLIANGKNMQNDILISFSVLLGLVFTYILKAPVLDSITGLLVSIWILKVAFEIFIQTNYELMDGIKDATIYETIFSAIDEVKDAQNPHRVRARKVGDKISIGVDIEVDGNISLQKAHEIAHEVEKNIRTKIDNILDIRIHVEPIGKHIHEEFEGIDKEKYKKFKTGKDLNDKQNY